MTGVTALGALALLVASVQAGGDVDGAAVPPGGRPPTDCHYRFSVPELSAPRSGGTTSVEVDTRPGCAWTVTSDAAWLTVSPPAGEGPASVAVRVTSSPRGWRATTLAIGGQRLRVTQGQPTGGPLAVVGLRTTPAQVVPQFQKLEIRFDLVGSQASMPQWPYDPNPPRGVLAGVGVSVDAVFTDPDGQQFQQPAFYAELFQDEVRDGRDWHLPTGQFGWTVRFTPTRVGPWRYKIVARDRSGATESATGDFVVTASSGRGFVRVSRADPRYFEFDDGSLFTGLGFEFPDFLSDPVSKGAPAYEALAQTGVNFVRVWISSMFGSAWTPWVGGRNQYRGYLPYSGLTPYHDEVTNESTLALQLDYEPDGDTGWFDACRMQFWNDPESVKPHTTYRIGVEYRGIDIVGPRHPGSLGYGLVIKEGDGWHPDCYEPGSGQVLTNHGQSNATWGRLEGTWHSGERNFLPRLLLGLDNVRSGRAFVRSVSLREVLADGELGPELMIRSSMEYQQYVPEERAHALDRVLEVAERAGVYLKVVVSEKNDKIYYKMDDNGDWADPDNQDGFYGLGRTLNKTRWLQQMWWRYLQARWGYSPNIHSWELTNEGDPSSIAHFEMADEFGKFMRCRAFGIEPGAGDGAECRTPHPNSHLVTTSFWQWFPAAEFWANPKYPNLDYADVHAYVSTSFAPRAERERMSRDAAEYHDWHSRAVAQFRIGKPIVRGEAGLDAPDTQDERVLGLDRDVSGVWLHTFLWAGLDSGALYELYWWNEHIWNGNIDHRHVYRALQAFLRDIPLNKGGYEDWGGSVTNPDIRVVGQKHVRDGAMHLWAHNRAYTWGNVVEGVSIPERSGVVVVPGFRPGATYRVERWDTVRGAPDSQGRAIADAEGQLRIALAALRTDVAFKVRREP